MFEEKTMFGEKKQLQDYLHWRQYQNTLEDLLRSQKELQTALKLSTGLITTDELPKIPSLLSDLVRYNEALVKVKAYVSGLSFHIQTTFERASSCLESINPQVAHRFNPEKLIQTMDSLILSYAALKSKMLSQASINQPTKPTREPIHTPIHTPIQGTARALEEQIYHLAAAYHHRLSLDRFCNTRSNPDSFYLHLASLFPGINDTKRYLQRYLHATDEKELNIVRKEIITQQQQWQKKKEFLGSLAKNGKAESQYNARLFFLQESGNSGYNDLEKEIAKVIQDPREFFSFRAQIQQEQSRLQEEITALGSRKMAEPESWKMMMVKNDEMIQNTEMIRNAEIIRNKDHFHFPIPNTIYGQQLYHEYFQTKENHQREIATHQRQMLRQLVSKAKLMPKEIITYEGTSYLSFLEEKKEEVSHLKQTITLWYPTITKNIFQETESLLENPPPPPIHSEEALWTFAYHYASKAKDRPLAALCSQIAGYTDGACHTLEPLHARVKQVPVIHETSLNTEDLKIYQRIHQGLTRYQKGDFKGKRE